MIVCQECRLIALSVMSLWSVIIGQSVTITIIIMAQDLYTYTNIVLTNCILYYQMHHCPVILCNLITMQTVKGCIYNKDIQTGIRIGLRTALFILNIKEI